MSTLQRFKSQFSFDQERAFHVGVERECFVADKNGLIVAQAPRLLDYICRHSNGFGLSRLVGYELSACQVETRTRPLPISQLASELSYIDLELSKAFEAVGLKALYTEVAPEDMPLDVYPDPTGRYARIVETMPRDVLLAACRVIGTHVHIGMPDHETALRVYNRVIDECDSLAKLGDNSNGERLAIYKVVASDPLPRPFSSWQRFYEVGIEKGFVDDPRSCWTLIRISKHGTIEFRMFGATSSVKQITAWARRCLKLCLDAHSGV